MLLPDGGPLEEGVTDHRSQAAGTEALRVEDHVAVVEEVGGQAECDVERTGHFAGGGGRDEGYPPNSRPGPPGYDQNIQEEEEEVWVEIAPGMQVELRKSEETRDALVNDFFIPVVDEVF